MFIVFLSGNCRSVRALPPCLPPIRPDRPLRLGERHGAAAHCLHETKFDVILALSHGPGLQREIAFAGLSRRRLKFQVPSLSKFFQLTIIPRVSRSPRPIFGRAPTLWITSMAVTGRRRASRSQGHSRPRLSRKRFDGRPSSQTSRLQKLPSESIEN